MAKLLIGDGIAGLSRGARGLVERAAVVASPGSCQVKARCCRLWQSRRLG
jgi:hypothetical protein